MPNVGVKPDGTLGWIDANGNEVNPDGSPIAGAQQLRPLQPTQANKPQPNQAVPAPAPATSVDIAPGAQTPATPTPTQQAQTQATTAGQTTPAIGAPQGPNGMFTVDQTTANAAQEVQAANVSTAAIWDQINKQQTEVDRISKDATLQATNPNALTNATSTLNTLYGSLSSAQQRVQTANAAYSTSLTKAIDQNLVDPSSIDLAKAQAAKASSDADTAARQVKVLEDGAPTQRALVAAQAGQASATAAAQQASADATKAKTPAEVNQLNAQANGLNAQAAQTTALLPGLLAKQQADTSLTQAQVGLTGSQSDLAQAQAGQATANAGLIDAQAAAAKALLPGQVAAQTATTGLTTAQAGLAGAQATGQLAGAASNLASIQQNLQGPLYGLQDRVNAIRQIQQQVFGPGGSGDPAEANDLLNQYVTSSVAGTTPYAANVAAANAGLTAFGTQASMYNAAQQALSQRGTALAGLGGNVLGTLAGINANAPAGSTAMAGAFKDVIDYMSNKMAAAQTQGGPGGTPMQQPTAPQLPALLQRLAPGGSSAVQGGMPGLAGAQAMPNPAGAPQPVATPMGGASPQQGTNAPVTINIGGQGQQQPSPPAGGYAQNQPGTYGQLTGAMPSMLQQYAPPTTDFVHQLWGNELGSGAVKSPYQAMTPQIPGPTPMPAMA
jgi:hypothetical protein